jgi:hypothetical protein
MNQFRT